MKVPNTPVATIIKEEKKTENDSQIILLTIQPPEDIWQYDVMNMKEIGKGPVEYLKVFNAPGLSYASTDWGNPIASTSQPNVLPSVFVKCEIPESHSQLDVSLEEGPEWCYKGYNVETLEDGKTYLLSNVAVIKYVPSDDKYEVANKIVLKLVYR
jgi:hypothetical protein